MREYTPSERRNREIVLQFYQHAILNWDFEAAAPDIGADYKQHNPSVADGAEVFARSSIMSAPISASRKATSCASWWTTTS